jgi:uncharacterized membrane protein YdjX (TVP38/TMEM64 family)
VTSNGWFWIKLTVVILLIVVALIAHYIFDLFESFTPDRLSNYLNSVEDYAPIIYIGIMALAVIVSPIPSIPLAVASGMMFGPFLGGVYSLVGALSGAIVSFLIARYFGREIIQRFFRGKMLNYPDSAERVLLRIVLISRLIPVVSFDVVSYGAGLTSLSLPKFAIATAIGMIPFTFAYTYYGTIFFVKPWLSVLGGTFFLVLFLTLPYLVRKHNLFHLRRHFYPE